MKKTNVRTAKYSRKTRETEISLEINFGPAEGSRRGVPPRKSPSTRGFPFSITCWRQWLFTGILDSTGKPRGDVEVDEHQHEHHLVEDTGVVLGEALNKLLEEHGPVQREDSGAMSTKGTLD